MVARPPPYGGWLAVSGHALIASVFGRSDRKTFADGDTCCVAGVEPATAPKVRTMSEGARGGQESRRQAVTSCLALCLSILLCGSVAHAQSVAFINPGK